ncbi:MAG: O-antigen ligase family protein [Veillonellales bacterium]
MKYLFLIFLLLNPVSYIVNQEIRQSQEFIFQISSIILIGAGLAFGNKSLKRDKFNLWFSLLMAWVFITYLIHLSGWSIAFNAFLGLMIYYTALKTLNKQDIQFLIKGISWVAGAGVLYLALQYFDFDLRGIVLKDQGITPHSSFFALEAVMGGYFAIVIPLLITFSWTAFLLFIPLIFSWSTGAYIGATVATFFYLWYKRRILFWWLLIPTISAVVSFIVFIDNPMGMQGTRVAMWKIVTQDSFRKPLTGHGLDSFRVPKMKGDGRYLKPVMNNKAVKAILTDEGLFIKGAPSREMVEKFKLDGKIFDFWDHPHNEVLWLFYETGIMGLILLGIFLYHLWQRFIKSKMSKETVASMASIVALFIFMQTQFPFHLARIAHIAPLLLAFFYISTNNEEQILI